MALGSCYGQGHRERIARDFNVTPLHHLHAPKAAPIESCSGRHVGTYFYLLEYQNQRDPNDSGTAFAGRHCAEALLDLLHLPHLKPNTTFADHTRPVNQPSSLPIIPNPPRVRPTPLTPLNEEISAVLDVLVLDFLPEPPERGGPVERLLKAVRASPSRDLPDRDIVALNTTVQKWTKRSNAGIAGVAENLASRYGQPVTPRKFPLLHDVLARKRAPDYLNPAWGAGLS